MTTNKIIKCYLGEGVDYSKFVKQMPEITFKKVDIPEFADIILVRSTGFDMSISERNKDLLKSYYDKVHALYFNSGAKELRLYKVTPSGRLTSPFISKYKLLKLCRSEEIPLGDFGECVLGANPYSLSQKNDVPYVPRKDITQERKIGGIYTYQDEFLKSVNNPCPLILEPAWLSPESLDIDKRLLLSL